MTVVAGVGIGMEKLGAARSARPLATGRVEMIAAARAALLRRKALILRGLPRGLIGLRQEAGAAAGRQPLLARWLLPQALADRAAARRSSVAMVELSMRPSTRAGRKWRWNALTTNSVVLSRTPVGSIA
jgi:hypothetical protein